MNDINNSEDILDVRDIIARVEELREERKPWIAGWNLPGYMPDNEPAGFSTWNDARDYISEELREYADLFEEDNHNAIIEEADALDNLDDAHNAAWGVNAGQFYWWIEAAESDGLSDEDREELATLESLLNELKGYGGDEQWNGDWYPVTLIRDSYFETAMDELLEDIGEMPKDIPSYLTISVNYDALQQDYSSVEYDGVTYWYR